MLKNKLDLRKIFFAIVAGFLSAFVIKIIISHPSVELLPDGIGGFSMLFSRVVSSDNSHSNILVYFILYITLNIPILIFGLKKIGKQHFIYSSLAVLLHSIFVLIIPGELRTILQLDQIDNQLLMAILAGLVMGYAVSLVYSNGFSFAGINSIGGYLAEKFDRKTENYTIAFNLILLLVALFLFNSFILVIYSLVYIFTKSLSISMFYVRNKKVLLQIVSSKGEEIASKLLANTKYTCTIYDVTGGYSKEDKKQLNMVIYYGELKETIKMIKNTDPESFTTVLEVRNSYGGNFDHSRDD